MKKINPSIKEIAEKAGVSIATVSRALNGKGPVKEATRQKILEIAQQYNYRPSPIARGLSSQKTDTIGLILPELVDEFFTEIIRGVDEEAHRQQKFVMVSSSHSQRNFVETILDFMSSGRVDGVILMAPSMQKQVAELVKRSQRPVVLINCVNEEHAVSFNINNFQGAFSVTQHLVNHGYRRIGMIQGPAGNADASERFRGFLAAMAEHNLPVDSQLVVPGDFKLKGGYYGFMRLMSQPEKPHAIVVANDMMAIGAYEAAKNANIRIPEDVALTGFDDINICRFLTPRLTTVHVPVVELGQKATQYLLKLLNNEIDPQIPHREELSTGLIIGGSCGCNNASSKSLF